MNKAFLIRGVAAIALSVGSHAAYAQTSEGTEADGQGITDIVVTAQRREESLQKVPIAVSAVAERKPLSFCKTILLRGACCLLKSDSRKSKKYCETLIDISFIVSPAIPTRLPSQLI